MPASTHDHFICNADHEPKHRRACTAPRGFVVVVVQPVTIAVGGVAHLFKSSIPAAGGQAKYAASLETTDRRVEFGARKCSPQSVPIGSWPGTDARSTLLDSPLEVGGSHALFVKSPYGCLEVCVRQSRYV